MSQKWSEVYIKRIIPSHSLYPPGPHCEWSVFVKCTYTLAKNKSFSPFLRFAGQCIVSEMRWSMNRVNKTEKSDSRVVVFKSYGHLLDSVFGLN